MEAVIFDMDGVLLDTERLCMEGWCQAAKKKGISGMEEVFRQCIGLNSNDTRALVLSHYGETFPYEEFRKAVSAWTKTRLKIYGLPVKPGVNKILPALQQAGVPVGLATSTCYSSVIDHLKGAGIIDYFRVIVTGDMIEHSKPEPDIYLLACRKLGVEPALTFAIEDSPNGVRAAYRAGVKPVMVPDLIRPDEEMNRLSVKICNDLVEVMHYIL